MKIFMFCQTVHPDFPIFLHGYIRPICDISQLCLFLWRISNHQNPRYSIPITNSIRRVSSQSNRGCLSARQGVTSRQFARNLSVASGQPMVAPGQPMQWLLPSNQLVTNGRSGATNWVLFKQRICLLSGEKPFAWETFGELKISLHNAQCALHICPTQGSGEKPPTCKYYRDCFATQI